MVSIFASQLLFGLALAVYVARLAIRRVPPEGLPVDAPLLAFCVWSLLSAAFSSDPVASHESAKKLVLFGLLYLAADTMRSVAARERVIDALLLGGIVLAGASLIQYHLLGFDTIDRRPHGFLGHYMTASGACMAILVVAAGRLSFASAPWSRPGPRDLRLLGLTLAGLAAACTAEGVGLFAVEAQRLFVAGLAATAALVAASRGDWPGRSTGMLLAMIAAPLAAWALLVSRTRNAWIGALAGLAVVVVLRAPRALVVLAAGVAALLLLRPAPIVDRLTVSDASSRDRIYMWQAGIDMIRDKPVFGQGPGMIEAAYPNYRWPQAPNPTTPHLHDNALQIAAERGLPCLAWWVWFLAGLLATSLRAARGHGAAVRYGVTAFAVLCSVMVAGLFEYNFGDSEVLMLLLLVSALPFPSPGERPAGAEPAPVLAGA